MPFLVADSISKDFGGRRVLSAASLRAEQGQVRVIFGQNGAGKSTLMKIAAGIVTPDTGLLFVNGVIRSHPSLASLARESVFYLPDRNLLSAAFTVGAQLGMFAARYGQRSVQDAARLANIEHVLAQRPHTLSGGELRRAELAAAITRRPQCLLADEPYRGIAPVDHDGITRILLAFAAEGCAVVVTGHEVPSLLALAHHVTWCTSGTTIELGPPDIARQHDMFQREYLGNHSTDYRSGNANAT